MSYSIPPKKTGVRKPAIPSRPISRSNCSSKVIETANFLEDLDKCNVLSSSSPSKTSSKTSVKTVGVKTSIKKPPPPPPPPRPKSFRVGTSPNQGIKGTRRREEMASESKIISVINRSMSDIRLNRHCDLQEEKEEEKQKQQKPGPPIAKGSCFLLELYNISDFWVGWFSI
ncbi:hypothetical protein BY996DRAFT_6418083 [Phakopsora pachyrhizi]|nr:hypothetical protein BY996DRAFT_6418083 [Phakopsora pachyrhizi]